jgi:predicted nucleic acid-binding protein
MTRDVLADTGPLYAANDEGDAYHQRSLRELKELARDRRGVIIAYPTLLECYSLMLFKLGRRAATEWLNEVETVQFVSPTAVDYGHAMATVRALADQSISLFDATLAALAMRLGVEVWTYDHDFDVMRAPIWRG